MIVFDVISLYIFFAKAEKDESGKFPREKCFSNSFLLALHFSGIPRNRTWFRGEKISKSGAKYLTHRDEIPF